MKFSRKRPKSKKLYDFSTYPATRILVGSGSKPKSEKNKNNSFDHSDDFLNIIKSGDSKVKGSEVSDASVNPSKRTRRSIKSFNRRLGSRINKNSASGSEGTRVHDASIIKSGDVTPSVSVSGNKSGRALKKEKAKTRKTIIVNPHTKTSKEGDMFTVEGFSREQDVLVDVKDKTSRKKGDAKDKTSRKKGDAKDKTSRKKEDAKDKTSRKKGDVKDKTSRKKEDVKDKTSRKKEDVKDKTSRKRTLRARNSTTIDARGIERDLNGNPIIKTSLVEPSPRQKRDADSIVKRSEEISKERSQSMPGQRMFVEDNLRYELKRYKEHFGGMEKALRDMADENGNYAGSDIKMDDFMQTIQDYVTSSAGTFMDRLLRNQPLQRDSDPNELNSSRGIPIAKRMTKAMDAFFNNPPDHKSFNAAPGRDILHQNNDYSMEAFSKYDVGSTFSDKSYFRGTDNGYISHNYAHKEYGATKVNFKGKEVRHSGTSIVAKLKPGTKVFNTSLGIYMRYQNQGSQAGAAAFNSLMVARDTKFEVLANDAIEVGTSPTPMTEKYKGLHSSVPLVARGHNPPSVAKILVLKQK